LTPTSWYATDDVNAPLFWMLSIDRYGSLSTFEMSARPPSRTAIFGREMIETLSLVASASRSR
jgi:hypothetical protein